MQTMIDLSAIEKRAKEATEGPWEAREYSRDFFGIGLADTAMLPEHAAIATTSANWEAPGIALAVPKSLVAKPRENAEFIAHAREDVPALVEEVKRLRDEIASATRFDAGGRVTIELRSQRDDSRRWAVVDRGCVLNKSGGWEYEPIPSSRDDAFIERTRFASADEARAALDAYRALNPPPAPARGER